MVAGCVVFFLTIYFTLTVFILPEQYMAREQLISEPHFEVKISEKSILLGESFEMDITTMNNGEHGDIHILSTSFPDLIRMDNIVRISTYNFTQTPINIIPGDKIIAKYSGGLEYKNAKYPAIEAMSRPVHPGSTYNMSLTITPDKIGNFSVYVKTVNIPNSSNLSHYPQSGILDHQEEFVKLYSIKVNP